MSFTGNENHNITLQEAAEMTENYRNAHPGAIKGFFYGKETLQNILNQANCVGIRIYYAQDNTGAPKLVLVGADGNENDLYNGVLAEFGFPCPDHCSSPNPLNS